MKNPNPNPNPNPTQKPARSISLDRDTLETLGDDDLDRASGAAGTTACGSHGTCTVGFVCRATLMSYKQPLMTRLI